MTEPELRTINIDPELHHELKIRAAETRKTIKELVEAALRLYLDGGPAKEGK